MGLQFPLFPVVCPLFYLLLYTCNGYIFLIDGSNVNKFGHLMLINPGYN